MIDYNQQITLLNGQHAKHLVMDGPSLKHKFQTSDKGEIETPEYSVKLHNVSGEAATILQSESPARFRHHAVGAASRVIFDGTPVETKYDRDELVYDMRLNGYESELINILDGIPANGRGARQAESWEEVPAITRSIRVKRPFGNHDIMDYPIRCWRAYDILTWIKNKVRLRNPLQFGALNFDIDLGIPDLVNRLVIFETIPAETVLWNLQHGGNDHNTRMPSDWNATDIIYAFIKAVNGIMYLDLSDGSIQKLVIKSKSRLLDAPAYDLAPIYGSEDESKERAGLIIRWKGLGEQIAPRSTIRTIGNTRGVFYTGAPDWTVALPDELLLGQLNISDVVNIVLDFDRPFRENDSYGRLAIPTKAEAIIGQGFVSTQRFIAMDPGGGYLYPITLTGGYGNLFYSFEFPPSPASVIKLDHSLRADSGILAQWPLAFKKVRARGRTFFVQSLELNYSKEILSVEGKEIA